MRPFSGSSSRTCATTLNRIERLGRARESERLPCIRLLTRREAEVARCLFRGMSAREAGTVLAVSPRTVERHIANMYEKLGVHGRAALLRRVFEH